MHLSIKECAKFQRVVRHVLSTALKSSVNWLWSVTALTKVRAWVSKILRLTFRPKMNESRRKLGRVQKEDVTSTVSQMEEHGPADDDREERGNIWKTMTWGTDDGEVPVMSGPSIHSGMENCGMVVEQKRVVCEDGPDERDKMEAQVRVSQQRSYAGHPNGHAGEGGG